MGFIQDFLDHVSIYESPTSFWKWSAYTIIAATLRDSVYRIQGDITIYPNIYTLFLAKSAVSRKGNPVNFAHRLISSVANTKIISGRTSIQAIIDELAHTETDKKTGRILKGGAAIFMASELASGLVADPQAVSILTDIYDLKTDFKHHLRTTGRMKIDRIVFSALMASNETLLKGVYDKSAVFGGLLGRTFLIIPDEFREGNSLFDVPSTEAKVEALVEKLKKLTQLGGNIEICQSAKDEYNSWYKPFRRSYKESSDNSGIIGRVHMHVLKLAMILMANDLTNAIEKRHMEEAISECLSLIPNYNTFVMASGKSSISDAGAILIPDLMRATDYMLSRRQIIRDHWSNFDADILDKLVVALSQAGLLKEIVSGNEVWYQLTQKAIDEMEGRKDAK